MYMKYLLYLCSGFEKPRFMKRLLLIFGLASCLFAGAENIFFVSQNMPNPFTGKTCVYVTTGETGVATMVV